MAQTFYSMLKHKAHRDDVFNFDPPVLSDTVPISHTRFVKFPCPVLGWGLLEANLNILKDSSCLVFPVYCAISFVGLQKAFRNSGVIRRTIQYLLQITQ